MVRTRVPARRPGGGVTRRSPAAWDQARFAGQLRTPIRLPGGRVRSRMVTVSVRVSAAVSWAL
jgi:hypothetical protein